MTDKEDNVFKSSPGGIRNEIRQDIEENIQKFKDPVVLGEMMYKILEERENTNRILKNILAKLEALEEKGVATQEVREEVDVLLPEVDEEIIKFVKELGKATAEEVREKFHYKGRNAASARLNKLFDLGILHKKQVGKKVYFLPS